MLKGYENFVAGGKRSVNICAGDADKSKHKLKTKARRKFSYVDKR